MKRTMTSFVAAAAVSMTLPLFAQQSSSTTTAGQSSTTTAGQSSATTADSKDKDEMILTGCVQKNKSGGDWLLTRDGATAGAASPAPTGTSGAATTTAPVAGDKTASGAPGHRFWNLGNASDIEKYANQTVQVTGRAKASKSGDEVKGTTGSEIEARDFDVKSVKPIAASCS
jgi:hypothetical protein